MVSIVERGGMWYAVYHFGDRIRSDQTNVVSSYQFIDKTSAEAFAAKMLSWGRKEAEK